MAPLHSGGIHAIETAFHCTSYGQHLTVSMIALVVLVPRVPNHAAGVLAHDLVEMVDRISFDAGDL